MAYCDARGPAARETDRGRVAGWRSSMGVTAKPCLNEPVVARQEQNLQTPLAAIGHETKKNVQSRHSVRDASPQAALDVD